MDLTRVILGTIVTEKSERLRLGSGKRTYTMVVAPHATKIDVKHALEKFYDVDVLRVRMTRVRPKRRFIGQGRTMEKRGASKRALVTLSPESKALDLASFSAS